MKMRNVPIFRIGIGMIVAVGLILFQIRPTQAQQSYVNNRQLNCYNHFNTTDGFVCNGVASSCLSYLTFRSLPPYDSPVSIAYLLGSEATLIAKANNISDVDPIPTNQLIVVPVKCSCAGHTYYQHNATYVLKSRSETYFSVANNTYQGLTTCQSLMAQNSFDSRNLSVDLKLHIPLRCACPTTNQTSAAVKYLLVYLVTWRDAIASIAARFLVQPQSLLYANRLSSDDNIFPFTPLLVPLTTDPSRIKSEPAPEPTSPPPPPPPPTSSNNNKSSKKWVLVGVATGAASLLLLALSAFLFYFLRRRSPKSMPLSTSSPTPPMKVSDDDYSGLPETKSSSWSGVSSQRIRSAVESLSVYKIEEVQRATEFFSETNKIRGSVYRGMFKGDLAAVKVMKGDVSAEINMLKRINHSNIVRLSGFCVSGGNTYLVYEYADSGALNDWLHPNPSTSPLSWKQRVEIAHDLADALNYLHNFAHPPYVHKNLKSSNILLDANLRAKLSNFGLATQTARLDNGDGLEEEARLHLTRHVVGTQGYMAPEYIENGLVTPKLDVFAFGVILLQLLSGKPAAPEDNDSKKHNSSSGREELLSHSIRNVLEGDNVRDKLRDFVDPALSRDYPFDLAFSMAQLAKICVSRDLNSRPDIADAFMTLSKIRSSTRDWDPADELEHSRSMSTGR